MKMICSIGIFLGMLLIAQADYHHDHGHEDHHTPAHYSFKYGVKDGHTGDVKDQWEMRHGDVVKGEYSVKEADGTIRTVSYTADPHNGFNAVVKKSGHSAHPHDYHHEPVIHHHEPIVHHHQPIIQNHHTEPINHHHQPSVHHHESVVHHPIHTKHHHF